MMTTLVAGVLSSRLGLSSRDNTIGISSAADAHFAVMPAGFLLRMMNNNRRNKRIFTIRTHRLPPLVPVKAYHCTQPGRAAKAFPMVSHGQLNPQFCRWKYSKLNQNTINDKYPGRSPRRAFTQWKPIQGRHMSRLLARNAAMAPGPVAFHTHHVAATFQTSIAI